MMGICRSAWRGRRRSVALTVAAAAFAAAAPASDAATVNFDFGGTATGVSFSTYTDTEATPFGPLTVNATATQGTSWTGTSQAGYSVYQINSGLGVWDNADSPSDGDGAEAESGNGRRINADEVLWFQFLPAGMVGSIGSSFHVNLEGSEGAVFYGPTGSVITPVLGPTPVGGGEFSYTLNYTGGNVLGVGFTGSGDGIKVSGLQVNVVPLPPAVLAGGALFGVMGVYRRVRRPSEIA